MKRSRDSSLLSPSALGLFPKLLFCFLAVAAIPLLPIAIRSELDARKVLASARSAQLTALAESLARAVDGYLEDRQRTVNRAGGMALVQALVRDGAWDDAARRAPVLDALQAFVGVGRAGDGDALALLDQAGVVRLASDPALVGQRWGSLPVAQRALRDESAVGDLVADGAGPGRAALSVAAPAGPGGALVLRLGPSALWSLLQDQRVGATGYSVLVDQQGTVLGHSSDAAALFRPYTGTLAPAPAGYDGLASEAARVMQIDPEVLTASAGGQGEVAATRTLSVRPWTVLVAQAQDEAFLPLNALRNAASATAGLALMLAGVVAAALAISIATPVRQMRDVLAAVGRGDLTQRVRLRRRDELGQLAQQVDGALDNLEALVSHAGLAADTASATSTEVAAASQQQAAALAEISATIEELARSAEQVAQSAEHALGAAESARNSVGDGVSSLERIKERSDVLAERLGALAEMSARVGEVADLIGEITNKTHILSVNAAIEAASAGEFGRRFAVVAQQVKQLADETRGAAGEVKDLIRQTQAAASSAVVASEGVGREVRLGAGVAQQADTAIEHVFHEVRTISLATQQQLSANRQVADAVVGTTDAVRQVALALEGLERQVGALRGRLEALQAAGGVTPNRAAGPLAEPAAVDARVERQTPVPAT